MVRRIRKRSKNKKGGSFMDKFKQGTADIGKGLQDARAKAGETYAGAQQGMTDFNESRKAQYQSKIRLGGDAEKISLFGKNPHALSKPRRPVLYSPTQDPLTLVKQANKPTGTIIGRGGKRKTKKRRKKKKRKTKKRRKGGRTRKWFKSQAEKDHEKSEKFREAAKRKAEQRMLENQPIQWDRNPLVTPEVPRMPNFIPGIGTIKNKPKLLHSKGSRKLVGGKKRRRKRKTKKRRRR